MSNLFLILAGVSGFVVVALGAFGAHGLRDVFDAYSRSIWEKAVLYQMFHTLALLGTAILQKQFSQINLGPACWGFVAGIIIFSGSLYLLAVTNVRWLGAITPLGGLAFLFGWLWLAVKVMK